MLVLDDGEARAEVHPEAGAAIGRYDLILVNGGLMPILQTAPHEARAGPYAQGLNLLLPFSNRISGGGFWYAGVFHQLERNGPGPYPIHGNAYARAGRSRTPPSARPHSRCSRVARHPAALVRRKLIARCRGTQQQLLGA